MLTIEQANVNCFNKSSWSVLFNLLRFFYNIIHLTHTIGNFYTIDVENYQTVIIMSICSTALEILQKEK